MQTSLSRSASATGVLQALTFLVIMWEKAGSPSLMQELLKFSDYIMPSNRVSLKSLLGLITFYSKFIPHLARFTTILNGYMPKDNSTGITISEEFSTAFKDIISAVSHHSSLIIPIPADPLSIFSDASTSGVGDTLCVYRDLQWLLCSFYSRQLLPRERNYAILDLEALALLATIHHFHYYLYGVYFKAFTDHKPLINILNGQPPSARLLRWKIKLSDYHFDIIHIAGEVNSVDDALSRH